VLVDLTTDLPLTSCPRGPPGGSTTSQSKAILPGAVTIRFLLIHNLFPLFLMPVLLTDFREVGCARGRVDEITTCELTKETKLSLR